MEFWLCSTFVYEFKCKNEEVVITIPQHCIIWFVFMFIMYFKSKIKFGIAVFTIDFKVGN